MKKKRLAKKNPVTRDSALALTGRIVNNIFWNCLEDGHVARALAFSQSALGARITAFIGSGLGIKRNDFRIKTAPFDPTTFFGKGFTVWRGPLSGDGLKGKPRVSLASTALEEINFEDVRIILCSEDLHLYRTELKLHKKRSIILGSTVYAGLIKDYESRKKEHNKILTKLYHYKGIGRIKFTGDVFRDPQGHAIILTMQLAAGGWQWSYEWASLPAFWPKSKLPLKKIKTPPQMEAKIKRFMGPRRGLVYPGL